MTNRDSNPNRLWLSIFMMGIVLLIAAILFLPTRSALQLSILALSMILFVISGLIGAARP
ncbi:MAG: hypothetical protein KME43_00995 [Myxacorys chilensis ATA2-1-KO14]|nr:hypothetical protein [Myxacorys chilensis ATA2-1-KO14]